MSFASRFAVGFFLSLAAAPMARAQDPETPREPMSDQVCCGRFHYRIPRMSFREMRPMRFDRMNRMNFGRLRMNDGRFRMRGLERSMERLNRDFGREFVMRDRDLGRHLELRERAMERMRGRLDRLNDLGRWDRVDRFRLERPLMMRRRWRTI